MMGASNDRGEWGAGSCSPKGLFGEFSHSFKLRFGKNWKMSIISKVLDHSADSLDVRAAALKKSNVIVLARRTKFLLCSIVGCSGMLLATGCLVDTTVNAIGAGKATSSGSSAEETSGGDAAEESSTGEKGGDASGVGQEQCGNLQDSVCLQRVPIDWYGPVQPQRSTRVEDLTACDGPGLQFDSPARRNSNNGEPVDGAKNFEGPDSSKNIFVDSLIGEPAACTSECSSELEIGYCAPMTFVMKKYDEATGKCGDKILDAPAPVIQNTCEHLDPRWLPTNDVAIGAIPPQPMQGEAVCSASGTVTTDVPVPKVGQYYRVCAGQEEYEGECKAGEVCTRFSDRDDRNRAPMGCIYRKGDVSCPSGAYNGFRVLLYGDAVDDRGCTECQVDHQKGELSCDYTMVLAANSPDKNCDAAVPTRAEDICLSQQDLAMDANGAAAVQGTYLELKYSGQCSSKDAEPTGKIELGEPLTLCCSDF